MKRPGLTLIELVISMILISILTLTTTRIFDFTLKTYQTIITNIALEKETYTALLTLENYLQNFNNFTLKTKDGNLKELIIYRQSPEVKNDVYVIKLKNSNLTFGGKSNQGITYTNLLCENIQNIKFEFINNSILKISITSGLNQKNIYTLEKLINTKYKRIEWENG